MKKLVLTTFSILFVAVLLFGITGQAAAETTRHPVSAYEYDCVTDWGRQWTRGDVLHIRDIVHVNVSISDDPELNGINTTVADADINLKTGNVSIRGTMSFKPHDLDGTWEGRWIFVANSRTYFGKAIGRGTGELEGQRLVMNLFDAEPDDEGAPAVCATVGGEPHGFSFQSGYVINPGR